MELLLVLGGMTLVPFGITYFLIRDPVLGRWALLVPTVLALRCLQQAAALKAQPSGCGLPFLAVVLGLFISVIAAASMSFGLFLRARQRKAEALPGPGLSPVTPES